MFIPVFTVKLRRYVVFGTLDVKAEKYVIIIDQDGKSTTRVRLGFGAAGEEVQRLLTAGADSVKVQVPSTGGQTVFQSGRQWRLLDIKQRIKGLTAD
jgi:hypothetical protein